MGAIGKEVDHPIGNEGVTDRDRWIGATNVDEDRRRERRRIERAVPLPALTGTMSIYGDAMTMFTAGTVPRNIVLFDEMKSCHARIIYGGQGGIRTPNVTVRSFRVTAGYSPSRLCSLPMVHFVSADTRSSIRIGGVPCGALGRTLGTPNLPLPTYKMAEGKGIEPY